MVIVLGMEMGMVLGVGYGNFDFCLNGMKG